MVALKLAKYDFSDEIIAAALVHDVIEDTDFGEENLRAAVEEEVFEIVKAVTNDDSLSWEEKKLKYIETVRNGSEGAKAVATADKVHNMESLLIAYQEQGPRFGRILIEEKRKRFGSKKKCSRCFEKHGNIRSWMNMPSSLKS